MQGGDLWRLLGIDTHKTQDLVLSVAFNFLPRGCGLQARRTVPSLSLCDTSELNSGVFPRRDRPSFGKSLYHEVIITTIITEMSQYCFSNDVL